MKLYLPKNEKHRQEMAAEAEKNRYRNWLSGLSDELIDWCERENLTISDFENLIEFTKSRFMLTYGKSKIADLKKDGKKEIQA